MLKITLLAQRSIGERVHEIYKVEGGDFEYGISADSEYNEIAVHDPYPTEPIDGFNVAHCIEALICFGLIPQEGDSIEITSEVVEGWRDQGYDLEAAHRTPD